MNEVALRLADRLFNQPLIQNQFRSTFVEEMIRPELGVDWKFTGDSWCGWDFERTDRARLEVKQSAAYQTWSKARNIKTKGAFDIAPRTGFFTDNGATWTKEAGRPAQLYVFAWNPEENHVLEKNWTFFVVPTNELPEKAKTISLKKVQALAAKTGQSEPIGLGSLLVRVTDVLKSLSTAQIDTPSPEA